MTFYPFATKTLRVSYEFSNVLRVCYAQATRMLHTSNWTGMVRMSYNVLNMSNRDTTRVLRMDYEYATYNLRFVNRIKP